MTKQKIQDIFTAILVWWPQGIFAIIALTKIYFDPESEHNLQIERIAQYDPTAAGIARSEPMGIFFVAVTFFVIFPIVCVTIIFPAIRKLVQGMQWFQN